MGVGSGLYLYDVVVKRSRSLSYLLMSSCIVSQTEASISIYGQNPRKEEAALSWYSG